MFLLPQRCYIPHGSLKEVLTYPDISSVDDLNLKKLMHECGLGDFVDDLEQVKPWSQVLSLGQQQMVGFVRLFLRCPDVILLDESSSALDDALEEKIYKMLETYFSEALIVSIGHKKSLFQYHHHILNLDQKDWVLNQHVF
jgi:putative ATP-binding cassette transporter